MYWDTYCFTHDVGGLGENFTKIFLMGMNMLEIDSFQYGDVLYRGFETMSERDIKAWKEELSKYYKVEEVKNHGIHPFGSDDLSDLEYIRIIKLTLHP